MNSSEGAGLNPYQLTERDALFVIDMQNDFMPGGALPVKGANEIIDPICELARKFQHIVVTRDCHPSKHISFASAHPGKKPLKDCLIGPYGAQPLWPDHCVEGTEGAEITEKLHVHGRNLLYDKGTRQLEENLSPFFDADGTTPTGLGAYLRERGIERTFFCGLALDVCVGWSAVDSARLGFGTFVIEELTRSTELPDLLSQVSRAFAEHDVRVCAAASLRPTH